MDYTLNMLTTNYLTSQEFAEYNPETDMSGYTDATISGMISRASRYVDNFLQYSLTQEAVTGEVSEAVVSSDGALVVYVSKYPVQSVQAITIKYGSSSVSLQLTDGNGHSRVQIPSRGRSIVFPYQQLVFMGNVFITNMFAIRNRGDIFTTTDYTAGYATIPDDIKDAVNLVAKDIFMRQANPQNLSLLQQGGIRMAFKDIIRDDGKSLNLIQAENILNSYKRVM